jgi:hypothetical protein
LDAGGRQLGTLRLTNNIPGGISVVLNTTIRDLNVGSKFKMFARYKDGVRRPKLKYGPEGTRLHRAYLRVRGHALGPCVVEITRLPFNAADELTVVEHLKGGVTMVRDSHHRLAPFHSGMVLQLRTEQPRVPNKPRAQQEARR